MKVYIDADSCPAPVRNIVFKACKKKEIPCIMAANREIPHPRFVEMIIVENREGEADRIILDRVDCDDLVITRDIPLAAELIAKGIRVINDRGIEFDRNSIRERLSVRNTMEEFRLHGVLSPAQRSFSQKEIKKFADCFDRVFHSLLKAD